MKNIIISESQYKRLFNEDITAKLDDSNQDDIVSSHEKEAVRALFAENLIAAFNQHCN